MDYEVVKQLKDAGFPQLHGICHLKHLHHSRKAERCEYVSVPTLEELIEACGKRFFVLRMNMDGSYGAIGDAEGPDEILKYGSTPTKAVARLWLALQAKE